MNLLRAFIAIEVPLRLRESICAAILPLQDGIGPAVRWVPVENMHMTLKFLGDVSPSSVELLAEMLGAEAERFEAFELRLSQIGSFPSLKRPRLLYVGIEAPAALEGLQRGIEAASRRLGYESEDRAFWPHLTIGRVRQHVTAVEQQSIRRALAGTRIDLPGTARVDSVHLFKSELKPTGSVYTRLHSAPLRRSPTTSRKDS